MNTTETSGAEMAQRPVDGRIDMVEYNRLGDYPRIELTVRSNGSVESASAEIALALREGRFDLHVREDHLSIIAYGGAEILQLARTLISAGQSLIMTTEAAERENASRGE